MRSSSFVAGRPCLEEIEGFRMGRRVAGEPITQDEDRALLEWERDLRSGRVVPAESVLTRRFIYQRGTAPRRILEAEDDGEQ